MKDKFQISIETMHLPDRGETENVSAMYIDQCDHSFLGEIDIIY